MSLVLDSSTDPRVKRTRKLLQEALRELLFERSFAAISVGDITDRATVNRATFYAHYGDKHELLTSLLKTDMGAVLRKRLPSDAAFDRPSLVAVATALFEFFGDMHTSCPKSAKEFEDLTDMALQAEIFDLVEGWLRASPRAGRPDETLATMVSWTIFGAAHRWSRSHRRRPVAVVVDETVDLLLSKSM